MRRLSLLLIACVDPGGMSDADDPVVATDPTDVGDGTDVPTDAPTDPSDPTDPLATDAPDPTDLTDAPDGPSVEPGNGELSHAPLAEGADVRIVQGSQGAWHIFGSARVCGLGTQVRMAMRVYDVETGEYVGGLGMDQAAYRGLARLTPAEGDCATVAGVFGYLMDPMPVALRDGEADRAPEVLSGCAVRLEMEFWTADLATSALGTVTARAVPDPVNVGEDGAFLFPDIDGPRVIGRIGRCGG